MISPTKVALAWKEESAALRMTKCLALLEIHGFVTADESDKIRKRMVEWLKVKKAENRNVT